MTKIEFPYLNPIKFHRVDFVNYDKYISKHMDDFSYVKTIPDWYQFREFGQPWQLTDKIRFQFQSSFIDNMLSLCDQDGDIIYTEALDSIRVSDDDPNLKLYQVDWDISNKPEGIYFLRLGCSGSPIIGGGNIFLVSEPLNFLAKHKNSLLLEYSHYQFKDDVIFETGFSPSIRIRGTLRFKPLSSKDSFFEDQVLSMQTLDSKPYRTWELLIGGASGIPDWLADRIGRILGCSNLLIDGKEYQRATESAKLEERAAANYPMRSYSIDLREAENNFSKIFDGDLGDTETPAPTIADNVKSIFVQHTGSESSAKIIQSSALIGREIIEFRRAQQPLHKILTGAPADASEVLVNTLTGEFTTFDDWAIGEEAFIIYK
jgi:hypothetical protein